MEEPTTMQSDMATFIARTVHEAGDVLLSHFRSARLKIDPKGEGDIVTEADRASEEVLTTAIRTRFPHDAILAEESGRSGLSSSRLWLIDPLEATYNFSRGLPLWGINVALVDHGAVAYAAFFDPLLNELYYA